MPASAASRRASGVTTVPPGKPRRAVVALGRAHLEERIELIGAGGRGAGGPLGRRAGGDARSPELGAGAAGCSGRSRAACGCSGAAAAAPSEITATTAPTGATSPA